MYNLLNKFINHFGKLPKNQNELAKFILLGK